ncbi:hypothetical protein BKI52_17185 [marine bacterium AO1-C]|nr:hypothetical protein BKI52_17185 [marine bacterium AO1-C]
MKKRFHKILSIFLTLVILHGTLPLGAYAVDRHDTRGWSIAQTEELNFWQKLLKILAKTNASEKEEEENKKEKEKEGEKEGHKEGLHLRKFLQHLQKKLVWHQTHEFQVSYYEWLHHAYLDSKAKRFHHLYIYFHKFKIPTLTA